MKKLDFEVKSKKYLKLVLRKKDWKKEKKEIEKLISKSIYLCLQEQH